jgi:hypothetical protein
MSYFKNLPTAISEIIKEIEPLQAIGAWKRTAGPVIEKQAIFMGIQKQGDKTVLNLTVKDPIWRQEIQFEARRILLGLSQELSKLGWSRDKIPTEISFQAVLPLKPAYSKFRRNKKLINT